MDKKTTIALICAVLFAGGSVYYAVDHRMGSRGNGEVATTTTTGNTTNIGGVEMSVSRDQTETVEPTIPTPNLSRDIMFGPFAVSPGKEMGEARIKELQGLLLDDHLNFENWIELGLTYSSVGDYEGAVESYEYAAALRPKSFLPHANMAFVYGWHLKDFVRAEAEYKKALAINPGEWYINQQLFEFYRFVLNDPQKARAFAVAQAKVLPDHALDFQLLISDLDSKGQ